MEATLSVSKAHVHLDLTLFRFLDLMPLTLPAMLLAWELNDSSVFEVKICKKQSCRMRQFCSQRTWTLQKLTYPSHDVTHSPRRIRNTSSMAWKLDESYPCKIVPATTRTRISGLPSRTLSWRMFAKSYPRRVIPATGRTLKLVPYFNKIR